MSTDNSKLSATELTLSLRDLAGVLVKHYEIHEGRYELFIEFQIGTGPIGPDPEHLIPGAMIGLSKVGLRLSLGEGSTMVDAAIINPKIPEAKPARKIKTAPTK